MLFMCGACSLVVGVVGSVGALFMRRLGETCYTGRLPRGLKPAARRVADLLPVALARLLRDLRVSPE